MEHLRLPSKEIATKYTLAAIAALSFTVAIAQFNISNFLDRDTPPPNMNVPRTRQYDPSVKGSLEMYPTYVGKEAVVSDNNTDLKGILLGIGTLALSVVAAGGSIYAGEAAKDR